MPLFLTHETGRDALIPLPVATIFLPIVVFFAARLG